MLNHIDLQGRLTKEPELRTTSSGVTVVTFTLAHDRDFQNNEVDFVECTAWRSTAEFVSKYFHKGQLVIVSGRLQSRSWTDRDNKKRTAWGIQCDNVYFCEKKNAAPAEVTADDFEVLEDDGDLPF